MAEEKKKDENLAYSAEEAVKHIEAELAKDADIAAIQEEAARKTVIEEVIKTMKPGLEGAYKEIPNKDEVGLSKASLLLFAKEIRLKKKDGKWEGRISAGGEEIKLETAMKGTAVEAIGDYAKSKLKEAEALAVKLGDNNDLQGTIEDALKQELRSDADSVTDKLVQGGLKASKRQLEATEKFIKAVKEFADKATPEMQTDAKGIVDKVTTLTSRRLSYLEDVEAHKKDDKKTKPDPKTLEAIEKDEVALKAEYEKLLGTDAYKDPKAKEAFQYVLRNQLSNVVEREEVSKLSSSKLGSDIIDMMGKTSFEKYAGVSANGKGSSNQAPTLGTGGRIAAGVGAAAAAAVAFKAFQSAGETPTTTDEKTGEQVPDPERSQGMFAKVAKVAVGVILTGALAVGLLAAARGGNPIKGFQEGQGVIGKFTSMVQSAGKFGNYRG
jgi:hypothetical protein